MSLNSIFEELEKKLKDRYGSETLYEELGANKDDTPEQITRKYRENALKHHPDRSNGLGEQRMKDINTVYEILSRKESRLQYDAWLSIKGNWRSSGQRFGAQQTGVSNEDIENLVRDYRDGNITFEDMRDFVDAAVAGNAAGYKQRTQSSGHPGSRHPRDVLLEYRFDAVQDKVRIVDVEAEFFKGLELGLSGDGIIYVQGKTRDAPTVLNGTLTVKDMEGKLTLPANVHTLEIHVKSSGKVIGKVAHKGRIEVSSGDVGLGIYAPLALDMIMGSSIEVANVIDMLSKGARKEGYRKRWLYAPPDSGQPIGTLEITVSSGSASVLYHPQGSFVK